MILETNRESGILDRAYSLNQRIESDMRELDELKQLSRCIASPGFEQKYDPNRSTEAPFEKAVMKINLMEERINREVDRLVDMKFAIHDAIDLLPDVKEQLVLRERYIHFKTWKDIAKESGYSVRWVQKLHDRAVGEFEKNLEKCTKVR